MQSQRGAASLRATAAGAAGIVLGTFMLTALSLPRQWGSLLLLGAFMALATIVVGHVRKVLLMAIILGIPFSIDINLFYRFDMAALNAIGGLHLSATTAALAVLYGLWFLGAAMGGRGLGQLFSYIKRDSLLAVYVLLVMVSVLTASDRQLGVFEAFLLLQVVALYFYLQHAVRTRSDVQFVTTLLMIGLLAEALVMIGLRLIGSEVTLMNITGRIDPNGRVGGTVGSPNGAGAFLTLLLMPALGVLLARGGRVRKQLALAGLLLGMVALILTMSRGGWLGFGVSLTVFFTVALRRRWVRPGVLGAVFILCLLVGGAFQGVIVQRLATPDSGAAYARWPLMQLAARVIAEQPLRGVGANNFAVHAQEYATGALGNEWISTVHNRYLLLWAESGLFALVSFLFFWFTVLRRAWEGSSRGDPTLSPLALGMMSGVLGFMVHMSVDMLRSGAPLQLFFVMGALITAIDRVLQTELAPKPDPRVPTKRRMQRAG